MRANVGVKGDLWQAEPDTGSPLERLVMRRQTILFDKFDEKNGPDGCQNAVTRCKYQHPMPYLVIG